MKSNSSSPSLRGVLLLSTLFMIAALGIAAFALSQLLAGPTAESHQMDTGYEFNGVTRIDPPRPMPDFTLTNQHGEQVSLSELRGQPALLFFGFTSCPDVCPTTVTDLRAVQRDLGALENAVQYVFISVDGNRDTPATLAAFFATRQADTFIGLTGDPETVRQIAKDYSVTFVYDPPDANGNYTIAHTPSLFLLDAEGQWRVQFAFGTDLSLIEAEIRQILTS